MDKYWIEILEEAKELRRYLGQNAEVSLIMNMIMIKRLIDKIDSENKTTVKKTTTAK